MLQVAAIYSELNEEYTTNFGDHFAILKLKYRLSKES